jgi:ribokinase
MSMARVAVVGSINMDVAVRVRVLPLPGETISGEDAVLSLGGKGANQAVAAARLGAHVDMIGQVGGDAFGLAALAALERERIGLAGVKSVPTSATGVALITIADDGQNMITVSPGANALLSRAAVLNREAALKASKIVLLQNETPHEAAHAAIQVIKQASGSVIVDPAPAQRFDPLLIAAADYLTPNETEARQLTGVDVDGLETALVAARQLVAIGASHAVVKLGAAGVVFAGASGEGHVPAPAVQAIDTVAAGDCFNGALAVAIADGMALRDALVFACRAASIAVTRHGASLSMPLRHELS